MAKKIETSSTYIALGRILHGGDRTQIGEQIDLLPSEAAQLLLDGKLKLAPTPAK